MNEQRVSSRYARALLETAREEGLSDKILADLEDVRNTINQSHELRAMTLSPVIQFWRKKKIYQELFESRLHKLTLNFIMLLTEKNRENLIPDICFQYEAQYNELNNILPIEIDSAVELPEKIKEKIVDKIGKRTNKKIIPDYKIDTALKGGVLIKINDWVYDASVKNQLEILFKKLADE
jgi:F-type H+-transporting ATPase subunit delta